MKVLFCIQSFALGGVERRLSQLIWGLSRNTDFELYCIVNSDVCVYPSVSDTRLKIIKAPDNRYRRKEFIQTTIEQLKPDIVHCWNLTFAYLCSLAKFSSSHKFQLISGTITTAYHYPIYRKDYYKERLVFMMSDAIISNSMAGIVVKKSPRKKSHVIYNGFDYSRLTNMESPDAIRKDLEIESEYIVSMASRVNKQKDVKTFIDVAERLKCRKDTTFVMIGDGVLLDYYKQYADQLNVSNLVFTGLRNDVESIMNASTIYVQCSKHPEGLSNSILEACAIGKPVIATDSGGTDEIITNGTNGYITKKGDVVDIAEKINYLLDNEQKREEMGKNSLEIVKSKFLLDSMVDSYIQLYKMLLR